MIEAYIHRANPTAGIPAQTTPPIRSPTRQERRQHSDEESAQNASPGNHAGGIVLTAKVGLFWTAIDIENGLA